MEAIELKMKQASAVLGVTPKDLQNLVQFKVLLPTRRDNFYWFDNRLLLEAKVALYLKESLGTSTEVLALFARALSDLTTRMSRKLAICLCDPRRCEVENRLKFVFPSGI